MNTKEEIKVVSGLSKLTDIYDVFIIDIWGVLHDGVKVYPGVINCLENLQRSNKKIIFLSNTPRPAYTIVQSLAPMGIQLQEKQFLTSGDIIRDLLKKKNIYPFDIDNLKLFHLGSDRNQDILSNIKIDLVDKLQDANLVLLSSYRDEDEDLSSILLKLKEAKHYNLPVVCANPDVTVQHGQKRRFCAGYFSYEYEKLGGKVWYFGKPHVLVYQYIFSNLLDEGFKDKSKFLMIGDTLDTDIKGAQGVNLDTLLVLTGNASIIKDTLTEQTIQPVYAMQSFQW